MTMSDQGNPTLTDPQREDVTMVQRGYMSAYPLDTKRDRVINWVSAGHGNKQQTEELSQKGQGITRMPDHHLCLGKENPDC